ncbi:uncharacterized protein DUF4249 [Algoriphagus boseongensis]|uniref:Uncharacterized protein DUF4249 n=1 Tax=Algoriphagus boseongensis TaxID=1442587 RepID=A0A4R6T243_9BACT|nr:DUF4249 family protein [Algoriphagus boseongensis]TDQ14651.1 uncharacterized protein DUF4249 [Algoriphagus boseongensis]
MNKLRIFVLVLLFLGFNSCVDQISFPLEKPETERLIVSGLFTNLDEPHTVFLSQTTSQAREPLFTGGFFTLNDEPRPVRGAIVRLVVPSLSTSFNYNEIRPGEYELGKVGITQEGLEYYLQIEIQGKTYRSVPQKMPELIGSDELSVAVERARLEDNPDAALAIISTAYTLPEVVGGYYLRWTVDEAYFWDLTFFPNPFNKPPPNCIVFGFPDPERITLVNGDLLNQAGAKSTQIVAKRLIDQSFLSRHYFNVRQLSITKETYEYWRKVRELVNNTGSVFDSPPAPIRGNIYNVSDPDEVVLGYFEVAKASVERIYTTRADIPFFIEKECEYIPGKSAQLYEPTCLSCSVFPRSQEPFPEWWFDQ